MRFGTLGGAHSNHALVLHRYLSFHGVQGAAVTLYENFCSAFAALADGELDYVLQCSVHPEHSRLSGQYLCRVHPVDGFIASSRPLGILTRADVDEPRRLGLQPATRDYADLSAWSEFVEEPSTTAVAEGLLAGRYESGLTFVDLLESHPGRFRMTADIGSVTDVWVLFAAAPLPCVDLVAWPNAPVRDRFSE